MASLSYTLDIIVLNEKGKPDEHRLTVILDDYSRAVAGYYLTFQDPSAIHTSWYYIKQFGEKETRIGKYVASIKHFIQITEMSLPPII
ncbi:hypothetical protein [Cytobacillus praedii]|uniref:hypothetical protein n=1 Tax=Cytobacillus praedii TaxID=1742358 RepID=UPI003AF9D58E